MYTTHSTNKNNQTNNTVQVSGKWDGNGTYIPLQPKMWFNVDWHVQRLRIYMRIIRMKRMFFRSFVVIRVTHSFCVSYNIFLFSRYILVVTLYSYFWICHDMFAIIKLLAWRLLNCICVSFCLYQPIMKRLFNQCNVASSQSCFCLFSTNTRPRIDF